jgi:hypothetical protein
MQTKFCTKDSYCALRASCGECLGPEGCAYANPSQAVRVPAWVDWEKLSTAVHDITLKR